MSLSGEEIELIASRVAELVLPLLKAYIDKQSTDSLKDLELATTTEMSKILSLKNRQGVYHYVNTGLFRMGKEVLNIAAPGNRNPVYRFNLKKCLERLAEENRRAV